MVNYISGNFFFMLISKNKTVYSNTTSFLITISNLKLNQVVTKILVCSLTYVSVPSAVPDRIELVWAEQRSGKDKRITLSLSLTFHYHYLLLTQFVFLYIFYMK